MSAAKPMSSGAVRTYVLVFVLIATALGIFTYKAFVLDQPLSSETNIEIWDFEIFLDFVGQNLPARLEVYVPPQAAGQSTFEEQFYSGAFGLNVVTEKKPNRRAVWSYRFPGEKKVLRYRAKITAAPVDDVDFSADKIVLDQPARISDTVKRQAYIVWRSELRRRSSDNETFAALALNAVFSPASTAQSNAIDALLAALPEPVNKLELAKRVLAAEGVPARIANGIILGESRRHTPFVHWLEYEAKGEIQRYFPGEKPYRVFTLWYGPDTFDNATGVSELDVQITIQKARNANLLPMSMDGTGIAPMFGGVNFNRLPVTTQLVYKILVTVPVGIMLLVFLRQFVGMSTGTDWPGLQGDSTVERLASIQPADRTWPYTPILP